MGSLFNSYISAQALAGNPITGNNLLAFK